MMVSQDETIVSPFEYKYNLPTTLKQLGELHKEKLEPGEEDTSGHNESTAGRMMMRCVFGKLASAKPQELYGVT